MTREQLQDYVKQGREIEFKYNGKMYSITYSPSWMDDFISFCEFDKETSDVKTFDELITITRGGVTVLQMLESLTDDNIWIY